MLLLLCSFLHLCMFHLHFWWSLSSFYILHARGCLYCLSCATCGDVNIRFYPFFVVCVVRFPVCLLETFSLFPLFISFTTYRAQFKPDKTLDFCSSFVFLLPQSCTFFLYLALLFYFCIFSLIAFFLFMSAYHSFTPFFPFIYVCPFFIYVLSISFFFLLCRAVFTTLPVHFESDHISLLSFLCVRFSLHTAAYLPLNALSFPF